MPISFTCSQCGKRYAVKDEMAGKSARCACGNQLVVPSPAAETPAIETPTPAAATKPTPLDRGANIRRNLYHWRKRLFIVFGIWFAFSLAVGIAAVSYAYANNFSQRRANMLAEGTGTALGILFGAIMMVVLLMAHRKKAE